MPYTPVLYSVLVTGLVMSLKSFVLLVQCDSIQLMLIRKVLKMSLTFSGKTELFSMRDKDSIAENWAI